MRPPGNGEFELRDSSPEIPLWVKLVSGETKRQRRSPPIAGHLQVSGKSRGSKECVVDLRGLKLRARHAVAVEPVSAYYRLKKLRNLGVFRRFNATN
jgi:hypothetical protein